MISSTGLSPDLGCDVAVVSVVAGLYGCSPVVHAERQRSRAAGDSTRCPKPSLVVSRFAQAAARKKVGVPSDNGTTDPFPLRVRMYGESTRISTIDGARAIHDDAHGCIAEGA